MTSRAPRTQPSRTPLDRERVLRAAVELADAEGIQALSMRRLAGRLGVEAMTLYYHVKNKDDVIDGMVDLVVQEFAVPTPEANWRPAVRATAISAHHALLRHPWAAEQMFTASPSPARLRWMDALLGTLRAGGFSPNLTHHAYHALDSHMVGFTLWETGIPGDPEALPEMAKQFLATLPIDDLPHLAEHIEQHVSPSDDVREFEFGLDLLLDGLERMVAKG